MRVEFPADIREDIRIFGGLKLWDLVYLIPAVIVGILFVFPPLPWPIKILLIVGIPFGTFLWLLFDAPAIIRKRRGFKAEPSPRTAAQADKNIQEIISVLNVDQSGFVTTTDQHVHIYLSLTPGAWATKTTDEKDHAGIAWVQAVTRALAHGMYLDCYVINDIELLRAEFTRQEREHANLPEGLRKISEARRSYWQDMSTAGFARSCSYVVRIGADPFGLEITPKPRSKSERITKTKQIMVEITRDVMQKLQATGASATVLSPELIRDFAARQLNPAIHREMEPVRETDWVRLEAQEAGEEAKEIKANVKKKERKHEEMEKRLKRAIAPQDVSERAVSVFAPVVKAFSWAFWLIVKPVMNLANRDAITVILVQCGDHKDSIVTDKRLSVLYNKLYAAYTIIKTITYRWDETENDLPADVTNVIKMSGYALVVYVIPFLGDIDKNEILVRNAAKKYRTKVDFILMAENGDVIPWPPWALGGGN
ncbi:MAG: hypothetical protein K6U04_08595 [Armatimonadetes bacterium]|nr:hypothetical protein [Armatimonadota bacterium]